MRIFLAIFLPVIYFLLVGRTVAALFSLMCMATFLFWPIASIWAVWDWMQEQKDIMAEKREQRRKQRHQQQRQQQQQQEQQSTKRDIDD